MSAKMTGGPKILVVEDEASQLEMLASISS